jgi:hypothetical protein
MKDLAIVLRQKEQDVERVRREIQALLTVVPLLADDQPSCDILHQLLLVAAQTAVNLPHNDLTELEIYYPFIKHLKAQGRLA